MRYSSALTFMPILLWGPSVYALGEVEPNSTVAGRDVFYRSATSGYTREVDLNGNFNDAAKLDPSLANQLPLNDEMIGQLGGIGVPSEDYSRDYDWFYLDVYDSSRPLTPVYFGCDQQQGFYLEQAPGGSLSIDPEKDITFQINYYYLDTSNPNATIAPQSSYVVGPDACRTGSGTTIGHFRFQMSTQRPGRYFVRVWGRYIGSETLEDTIEGTTTTRRTAYDQIVVPTGSYSLRVYTSRVPGALEPNDGMPEAFPLVSGTTTSDQLASMYDHDWFYIDNDISVNTSQKIPFYFTCSAPSTGSYTYNISARDYWGVEQANYKVSSDICSRASGFSFTLNAPVSARYYFVVSPPTFAENAQFTQANYTVLAVSSPNSPLSGVPSRLPGQQEPNDTLINAFPLTTGEPVTGAQISSVSDFDYYHYDNAVANSTASIYFKCTAPADSEVIYTVNTYDPLGTLQKSYSVDASACNAAGGFKFDMATPSIARYYVLVSQSSEVFSTADYTLSTAYILANEVGGALKSAAITTKNTASAQDRFNIKLGQCGTKKGSLTLSGRKLNLSGIDANSQVNIKIGSWSCVSNAKRLTVTPSTNQKTYNYPAPTAAPQKKKVITSTSKS